YVEFTNLEHLQYLVGDLLGLHEADLLDFAEIEGIDDIVRILAAQDVVALAAHGQDLDRLALADELGGMLAGEAGDRRVEPTGQATLASGDDQQMHLILARAAQQRRGILLPLID